MELHIQKKEKDAVALWSETNFVEFPYFKLGKKNSTDSEIKIEIDLPEGTALWHVTNSEGLPGILSYEVFTALELELEKSGLSGDGALYFSIADILSTLGWKSRGGADYRAIREAIDKIVDTKITAHLTLQDKEKNQRGKYHNFRLLTEFQMTTISYPDGSHQDVSMVRFNSTYLSNRTHGYVSPVSVKTFFEKLKSPVAKRLYQYLNKRAFFMAKRGDLFSIDVIELGTLMGLKAKYISDIDKTLRKAHEELIGIDFLLSAELVKVRGRGSEYRYQFSQEFQNREVAERKRTVIATAPESEISQELLSLGIARNKVESMIRESLPQVKLILRHLKSEQSKGKKIDNPAGFIYSFLRNEWSIPEESRPQIATHHKVSELLATTAEQRGYKRSLPSPEEIQNYYYSLAEPERLALHKEVAATIGVEDMLSETQLAELDILSDSNFLNDPFLAAQARVQLTATVAKRLSV